MLNNINSLTNIRQPTTCEKVEYVALGYAQAADYLTFFWF
jgi:hypothetical protein